MADIVDKYENSSEEDKARMGGLLLSAYFEAEVERILSLERTGESLQGMTVDQWCEYKSNVLFQFSSFNQSGSNIFHVQEELLEMFKRTDVGDVLLSDIITPFDAFYLYFGKKDAVKITEGRYVDGAYVDYDTSRGEYSLHICLTERCQDTNFFDVDFDEFSFLMKEDHIDYFISGEEGDCVKDANWFKAEDFEIDYGNIVPKLWERAVKECTNIIINTLCFMASQHNDVVRRFPDETPASFVNKVKAATKQRARETARDKARRQGYIEVNFLGDSIKREYGRTRSSLSSSIPSHWRRGHWRKQPCGERRLFRKLKWIKPTLVRSDAEEQGLPRVYRMADNRKEHT
jgi:hypothetical protein